MNDGNKFHKLVCEYDTVAVYPFWCRIVMPNISPNLLSDRILQQQRYFGSWQQRPAPSPKKELLRFVD